MRQVGKLVSDYPNGEWLLSRLLNGQTVKFKIIVKMEKRGVNPSHPNPKTEFFGNPGIGCVERYFATKRCQIQKTCFESKIF